MSGRASLGGGFSTDAAASRAVTLRKLDSLPPMPSGSVFKPSDLPEPALNKFTLFESYLLSFCAGVALVASVYILVFG